jgi:hypothetical protein
MAATVIASSTQCPRAAERFDSRLAHSPAANQSVLCQTSVPKNPLERAAKASQRSDIGRVPTGSTTGRRTIVDSINARRRVIQALNWHDRRTPRNRVILQLPPGKQQRKSQGIKRAADIGADLGATGNRAAAEEGVERRVERATVRGTERNRREENGQAARQARTERGTEQATNGKTTGRSEA